MAMRSLTVRWATEGDAREITRLRQLMFQSMRIPESDDPGWLAAAERHFRRALSGRDLVGAVVDADLGRLASCGVIEFQQRIPSPFNPTGTYAYISTMSTEPGWRRRGCARAVLESLLEEADRRHTGRVELHATAEGARLYRSLGFVRRDGAEEMSLQAGPRS